MDALLDRDNRNEEMAGQEIHLLHRTKRDLTWDDVEEFYADKNNFAMYLVLPIIVLVYGGCAVIYCIARCRRYLKRKRKKEKSLPENEIVFDEPTDGPEERPSIPVVPLRGDNSSRAAGVSSSSEVRVSVEREPETPLPWQVPAAGATGATAAVMATRDEKNMGNGHVNKGYETEIDEKKHPPPPSYEEMYKPIRPMSKPPPYEEKGIRQRKGSVEEIITLEAKQPPVNNTYNDRKRRRPGSRPASRQSTNMANTRVDNYDEEREKARQLVRGDRPKREPDAVKPDRQKTPDIISHARTRPLQPPYKPTNNDPKAEATLMARQAAQLLRLDHMGRQAGKKQKRLVFVAE